MAYFHTKNLDLGKFWMVLLWKMLVYLMAICPILRPFGTFMETWNTFSRFGMLSQDKSGNPADEEEWAI
jgi:hypothetical protein